MKTKKPRGRFTETQKKVQAILAMPDTVKKQNLKPVCFIGLVSVLSQFENKIDKALFLINE
jgi:hypothetical protein